MIVESGHFALILALFVAIAQSIVPLVGAQRGNSQWMAMARPGAVVLFVLVAAAFLALTWASVANDFSLKVVFENSHSDKPLLYRISGVWGDHEGSMLLWVLILTVYGLAVALFGGNLPAGLRSRALSVQAMISVGFLLFILLTSNPFLRLDPVPVNGRGMNPILQDPGLALHPPCLYLGYVGFSMAFSFAVAALIEGRVDAAWARWVRPWTLLAWCFLTLGIALGSWWAYYTLGWGGWWYWDPVENASLMPWLAGTALLHSSVVVERRDTLKAWTILLAIFTFALSLLGTFLVRSGVLTSVHAFATDPARGVFVLGLLAVAILGSLVLFAVRAPALRGGGLFAPVSREGGLLLNNVLLTTAAATVLLGTLYPLIVEVMNLGKISVGPPFFNSSVVPMMVPLVVAVAIGPLLSWKRGDLAGALGRLKFAFLLALAAGVAAWWLSGGGLRPLAAAGGIVLAVWLFAGSLVEPLERIRFLRVSPLESLQRALRLPRSFWGMTLAHMGLAVVIAGITGATAWRTERILVMRPGETVNVAGFAVTLDGVDGNIRGPNYTFTRGRFTARLDGKVIAHPTPERRQYAVPPQETTGAAIHTNLLDDLYVVIGDPSGDGYVVRIYENPLLAWLFLGAGIMVAGGGISLSDRRHRIGAPRRAARGAAAAAAAKA